jgi:cyclase
LLKKRLIPLLLLKDGLLVRSERFTIHQIIGNPFHEVIRFNEWSVDELIYVDISQSNTLFKSREDTKIKGFNNPLDILKEVSKTCFMPLTWGGKINSIEQMRLLFSLGADKITLNTAAIESPNLITQAANLFGSQAIVVSIDVVKVGKNYNVYSNSNKKTLPIKAIDWAQEVQTRGAGEILIQSVEKDGTGEGYDYDLIYGISSKLKIPLIACSGVGDYSDFSKGIEAGADAVAAANIWHFKELVDRNAKRIMAKNEIKIRI